MTRKEKPQKSIAALSGTGSDEAELKVTPANFETKRYGTYGDELGTDMKETVVDAGKVTETPMQGSFCGALPVATYEAEAVVAQGDETVATHEAESKFMHKVQFDAFNELKHDEKVNPNVNQAAAANPCKSVWVSASAGSGKTRVLSNRVLNLLLGGTEASKILCLTFTKAAAAEMENRIADRLSSWVSMSDEDLSREISELGTYTADDVIRKRARQLFAKMLDAKGGMKIMTIHSFCQTLLKRFPIEAGVFPNFKGVDDAESKILLTSSIDKCLNAESIRQDVDTLSLYMTVKDISSAILSMDKDRAKIERCLAYYGSIEGVHAQICKFFSIDKDETADHLFSRIAEIPDESAIRFLAVGLEQGGVKGRNSADKILSFLEKRPEDREPFISDYISAFLTKEGTVREKVVLKSQPDRLLFVFTEEGERIKSLLEQRDKVILTEAALAFLRIFVEVFALYRKEKDLRGWLDFTDLILKAKALLQGGVPWVLYKLDGGISHILIDEAQDTNPEQWDIINALTEEFFVGQGMSDEKRTIFAVGDMKQSIFSFQGANPEKFSANKDKFSKALLQVGDKLQTIPLQVSFRSSQAVLDLVNKVLANPEASDGIISPGEDSIHISYRAGQSGLVEIWPLVKAEDGDESDAFLPPIDNRPRQSSQDRLACKIADKIKCMLSEDILESENRRITASDIMILVRHRGSFFEKMVRALKERQIPVTGVDRMVISQQLACMDLISLGNFLCLPEDDLNLACLLKSPLYGFTEEELFAIAANRGSESLWNSLIHQSEQEGMSHSKYAEAVQSLQHLQDISDWVLPSFLYGTVLGAGGGKKALIKRLGYEAEDAIDEFFNLILDFEKSNTPSLQNFLLWLAQRDIEIKRDLEQGDVNAVRITTVHASKGLEAPIVFIPDTRGVPQARDKLLWLDEEAEYKQVPFWSAKKAKVDKHIQTFKDVMKSKQLAEYRRLLYVALTRPRDRLYIAGWETKKNATKGNWYELIVSSLPQECEHDLQAGNIVTISNPQTASFEKNKLRKEEQNFTLLPNWARTKPKPESVPPKPLSPSRFLEAEEAASYPSPMNLARQKAVIKGNVVHKLLEILPEVKGTDYLQEIQSVLQEYGTDLSEEEREEVSSQVLNVIGNEQFRRFFGENSKAEVSIIGMVNGKSFSGKVDRLSVFDDEIIAIDYKTGKPCLTPDTVPKAYKEQVGIYKQILQQIFAGKKIRTFLLWVETVNLMEI